MKMLGGSGLLAAAVLTLTILVMNVGQTSAATSTLVPNADKANAGGWTDQAGISCGADSIVTVCSITIDEDIDSPNDVDYIQSVPNPGTSSTVQFQLTDSPGDLVTLTDLTVRFRAAKTGVRTETLNVQLFKSDDTQVGSPTGDPHHYHH